MAWPGLVGHDKLWEQLKRSVANQRLASTFLFVGPPGIGKRTTALKLAQGLLCESTPADQLDACEACPSCAQIEARSHPDLVLIEKPADRNFIPIELFIGDREHRMRVGLCHDISLKPFSGNRKIAIIDDADHLNQEGANCLLKTLEEPPGNSLIILIGTSQHRQLPTIRSRCQIVRFSPLNESEIASLLVKMDWVENEQQAAQLAARAEGNLQRAIELNDNELEQARESLLLQFARHDFDSVELVKQVVGFVDAAGKDAPARRARLRQVLLAMIAFYRHLLRNLAGHSLQSDRITEQFVAQARNTFQADTQEVTKCLERCMEGMAHIDANANLPTLIACWVDDLAQITLRAGRTSSVAQ